METMRNMNANSVEVYKNGVEPTRKTRKERIKDALLSLGKATMKEIAQAMNVPVHTISGRFGELQRDKVIRVSGTRKYKMGSHGKEFFKHENVFELIS